MLELNHEAWEQRAGSLDHTAQKEAEKQDVEPCGALDHVAGVGESS